MATALGVCARIHAEEQQLAWSSTMNDGPDPALKEMTYDIGDGEKTFMAYVEPDVTSFYAEDPPSSTRVVPKFTGLASKFINLSKDNIRLYWEAHENAEPNLIRNFPPFNAGGTASFPGHRFFFATDTDPFERLESYLVGEYPENLYVYDPYKVEGDPEQTEANLEGLNMVEKTMYLQWDKTLKFNDHYFNFTGRTYLANYMRPAPEHFMWRADHFGQQHWVTSKETHFVDIPSRELTAPVPSSPKDRILKPEDKRILSEYRDPDQGLLNMTLTVLSCAPRVFEIQNFLSPAEVQHIMELAGQIDLKESTTGDVGQEVKEVDFEEQKKRKTRTSKNSWVERERSLIVDAIYRRAADVMRIDEAKLRRRDASEYPEMKSKNTIAEALQLVHYDKTQEYTAHHDFGYTKIEDMDHGARFATLLLYLNDVEMGGETSFPRWVNAETFQGLKVKPQTGKAVLFYSQLPDGNMDDFSQHAALPVLKGEKWLINLWVWDPVYGK
eukprot:CAMPEP_0119556374 /NCGR_PEP_ID=MMETSP1352-20130426/8357_1 /TAXON_ID=265584 /ORGANISM="Stauroneis constricta, Strain CCMP1120" /LENGTH=497 /DNA_ID=CAMNT_0007603327 /DNA_START=154 /DNA_END=1647 /DNA_ORIENTATION=+